MKKLSFVAAALLLTALSCQKPIVEQDYLKIVPEAAEAIVVSCLGEVSLNLEVSENFRLFYYEVEAGLSQISLQTPEGQVPQHVYLKHVDAVFPREGKFTAVIGDIMCEEPYEERVQLVIDIDGKKVASAVFSIRCESGVLSGAPQTGLPVVYIATENAAKIKNKVDWVNAIVKIDGNGKFDDLPKTPIQIRGRGNTTWDYPKKPYLFKFESKTAVLGMPKHKRWVLLANYLDKTLMRNDVTFKVSTLTSLKYTTRAQFCEVVLNGKHLGNYQLVEQIRVDKNRLNISEENGFLYELDGRYRNEINWTDPHGSCWLKSSGIPFSIKFPDEDDITAEQIEQGKAIVAEVAGAIYSDNFTDPDKGYRPLLDVRSFADYWIVFELMTNHELANPLSIFMFKDDKKPLAAGPVWDFDWGTLSFVENPDAKEHIFLKEAIWYVRLFRDPYFVTVLKERWNELYPALQTVPDYMDEKRGQIRKSADINFQLWDITVGKSRKIINGDELLTFDDAVDLLKANYLTHLETMNREINEL
ncbi:MAG: CotH kinase family protein [Bacteroidales bacterium]|nr:CotH kinase family protein [Bacteroidales bacterium]